MPEGSVAVTGAAGYLGGRIATGLGPACRALVRSRVPWLPQRSQHECDLLGGASPIAAAIEGSAAVVHLAGHNEVVVAREPERAVRETVAMARAVREAVVAAGVARVVYVSTVHVYGDLIRPGATLTEDLEPSPRSRYAQARAACEEILTGDPAFETVVLRLTNAVGAPADPTVDRWTLVASDLCRAAVLDRTMVLRSTGQQWRDFITLEDACRMTVATVDGAVPAGVYNLAAGRPSMVRSLASLVQERVEAKCGWRPELQAPQPAGDPDEPYLVSTERLRAAGLSAQLDLAEGVDELIDHCLKHQATLRGS